MFQEMKRDPFDVMGGQQFGIPQQQLNIAPAPTRKPGMFAAGGTGSKVLGVLSEAMAAYAAGMGAPQAFQAIQARKAQQADEDQYQRRQQDQWNNWVQQQQWKLANPEPMSNDTVNDYNFRLQTLGKEAADLWLKRSGDPIVNTVLPGNRFYSGPASGLASALGGGGQPQASADDQPGEEDGFVYTPGPGGRGNKANWQPKGGQSVAPTGGFPRPF